ncbi:MAG: response regulator [Pseudomonadales bacterium]|nr:response regulator [Pseudomonadales bacterium]
MKPNGLHRHSYLLILLAILPTCAVLLMTGCLLVFVPGIPETVLAVGIVLGFLCFVPGAMLAKLLQQNLIRNYEDARDLLLSRESGQVASASLSTLISRVFQDHNDRLSGLDQQCHELEQALSTALVKCENLQTEVLGTQHKSALTRHMDQQLFILMNQSLTAILGFTNLVSGSRSKLTDSAVSELASHTRSLMFYIAELERSLNTTALTNRQQSATSFSVPALVDECLLLVNPLLERRHLVVVPGYQTEIREQVAGDESAIKKSLFCFLLNWLSSAEPSATPVELEVRIIQGQLRVRLIGFVGYQSAEECIGLAGHLALCDGTLTENELLFPVDRTAIPDIRCPRAVRVLVAASQPAEKHSLETRLRLMGAEVTDNVLNAQVCILQTNSPQELENTLAVLPDSTRIYLHRAQTPATGTRYKVLKYPVQQADLAAHLKQDFADWVNRKLSLLVVDDDPNNRALLSELLQASGFGVTTLENGRQAVDILETTVFDLVFMDIHMPVLNGLDATRMIRENGNHRLPIIALTAHALQSEIDTMSAAGFNEVVLKPVNNDKLRSVIQTWLGTETTASEASDEHPAVDSGLVFDEKLALKLANNKPSLAFDMLSMFMASLPEDQQTMNNAYEQMDTVRFADTVHKINGATRYCGLPELQDTISQLEEYIKKKQHHRIAPALADVNAAIRELRDWHASETGQTVLEALRSRSS